MIKMVALDLDDTLLQPDGTISAASRQALTDVRARGVLVTLATGRMYCSAVQFARQLELDLPLITYQGALIKTSRTGCVWRALEMPVADVRDVLQYLEAEPVHINLYVRDELVVREINEIATRYASFVNVSLREVGVLSKSSLEGTIKVVAIGNVEYIGAELLPRMKHVFGSKLTINTSRPHFLEIGHCEATKSNALAFLGERLGIAQSEIMAIGDGQNDLDMIEYAGFGVAMGNADPEVKSVADYVTSSNTEEGVANALHKFILD